MNGEYDREPDDKAYRKALAKYEEEHAVWLGGEAARIAANREYESRLREVERIRVTFQVSQRSQDLAMAAMRNELAQLPDFDWMLDAKQGRATIDDIIHTAARGRIDHPEPEELPVLALPRMESAADGPTQIIRDWLRFAQTDPRMSV